ncbi:hypothetical protein PuT2_07025 [Pusillimonas sp. T2]|uniref:type II toxin-antitoxin system RelE/ParE family toxin n=1 Tax=Pusillimonas sp. T2 TaxID=1548123 RepID=UPI000B946714|nr:type II toxin-antitoxin system RelE/ParE family toxin [Pusillimonas sp. T2]OXR49544.1 hypothetical protein PuT2_07025 [Pusillimonas sp. T2]
MSPWHVTLLPAAEAELLRIPNDMQARFVHICELLESFGPHNVGLPHIRHLKDKLWEIRITGRDGIARAIYVASGEKTLTIPHVFIKKTQKTPQKNMAIAQKRLQSLHHG